MWRRTLGLGLAAIALSLAVAGCGSDKHAARRPEPMQPPSLYAGLPFRGTPGERVYEASGCAACHRIGTVGNTGPGPRLTHVGARLDRAQLRRTLIAPRMPMPSFRSLPPAKREALVTYLSRLR